MKAKRFTAASRAVRAAVPLGLLLLSPLAGAREPERRGGDGQLGRPQREVSQPEVALQNAYTGQTGASMGIGISELRRQVTPDPERQQKLSGQVVELKGQTLYVQGDSGTVVPFDVSALRFSQQPEEGQEVRVTYQVEDETDNVAVGLEGEVRPPAEEEK